jgi:DHA3 family tetracycline resistance protein-like MFS transporter
VRDSVRIFCVTRFLTSFALGTILPVYVLYFRHYQINLFQIALLAAVFEASILLLEIPTGLVADMFGRRNSVILSAMVSVLSGAIFIFFPFLAGFIAAEIVAGLGETLRSGALEAWLVDSLKYEGREDRQKHVFAQGTRFKTAGNLCGLILGGYLASLNMKLVWVPFTVISVALCLFLLLRMKEHYRPKKADRSAASVSMTETIKQSLLVLRSHTLILGLLVLAVFSEFSFETISQYWQVHFDENLLIPAAYFGWILAAASVVTILFVGKVARLSERLKRDVAFLMVLEAVLLASLFFISLTVSPVLAVVFFVLLQASVSFKEPILLDVFNRHIPSEQRATLLSFKSLVGSGGEVLAGLCIGVVAQQFGLRITFGLGSAVLLLGLIAFLLVVTSGLRKRDSVSDNPA